MVGDIPVLAQCVLSVQSTGQTVWATSCTGSHADQAHVTALRLSHLSVSCQTLSWL